VPHWSGHRARYLRGIFAEAAGPGRFGADYFERRLHVGKLHNHIDLPLKWYLGGYTTYFDLLRSQLRRRFPHRPLLRARAERALVVVFNLDVQAIVEAFYFGTFATMGVDLTQIKVSRPQHDLSDQGTELKATVRDTLTAVARATNELRDASQQMASTSEEAGRAVGEIANAVSEVAIGADRRVRSVASAKALVEGVATATTQSSDTAKQTAGAADEARRVAQEGADAHLPAPPDARHARLRRPAHQRDARAALARCRPSPAAGCASPDRRPTPASAGCR
jgi:methyl-accepting chemotaxis protein